MKGFVLLLVIVCVSTAMSAQKADAALVLGGAFASDIQQTFTPTVGPSVVETFKFEHHFFLEGAASVRLLKKFLPASPISPWVSVGGGWARYSSDDNVTVNKGAVQYGGGLDFKTGLPLLGFRAEVRDFVTSDPSALIVGPSTTPMKGLHHHSVLVGGGIVLRF